MFADVLTWTGGTRRRLLRPGRQLARRDAVVSRLGAALDTQVPVRALFEASTVESLAARVQVLAGSGSRPADQVQFPTTDRAATAPRDNVPMIHGLG
ncbi:hypothetical protein GS438_05140 [Rhodococcus hoagii]|nr:hypothetical protein [Prescottella equi]